MNDDLLFTLTQRSLWDQKRYRSEDQATSMDWMKLRMISVMK